MQFTRTDHFGLLEKVFKEDLMLGAYPLTLWSVEKDKTHCVDGLSDASLDSNVKDISASPSNFSLLVLSEKSTLYVIDANT